MQPTLCSRCKKNVAVIFITRIENGESHNEGLCLRCARELHIKPVDEMMEKLGISDADLDNLTGDVAEMLGSMGMLCLLYTSPSPRDSTSSRMPSSA